MLVWGSVIGIIRNPLSKAPFKNSYWVGGMTQRILASNELYSKLLKRVLKKGVKREYKRRC